MIKYLKLQLDKCIFWQKEDDITNPSYVNKKYVNKNQECLNSLFFRVSDNVLQELFTGKKFNATIKDSQINIKDIIGIEFLPDAFSYVSPSTIAKNYYQLEDERLKEEYIKIIDDILVNSPICDIKQFEDKSFSLKKIFRKK